MADNVKDRVQELFPKRGVTSHFEFKYLLDQIAQDSIIEIIEGYDLPARLISEEGNKEFNGDQYFLTVDPVDGTTNLSRGLHPSVTSISVATSQRQRDVIAGIVSDLYTGDTFYAEKNKGATFNGDSINVAEPVEYRHGLISMDISKVPKLDRLAPLIRESLHIRSEGCSAVSLCHIASGVLDAHIDLRGIVRSTDISAGLLILREAGGVYTINGEIEGELLLKKDTSVELIAASGHDMLQQIENIMKRQ
jgi:myo-inositol-1(or 4)-monophosphatase